MRVLFVLQSNESINIMNGTAIAQHFAARNHEVLGIFTRGRDAGIYPPALMGFNPDFILIGLGRENFSEELSIMVQAKNKSIPFGIYSELGFHRQLSKTAPAIAKNCSVLFSNELASNCLEMGFKNAVTLSGPVAAEPWNERLPTVSGTIVSTIESSFSLKTPK